MGHVKIRPLIPRYLIKEWSLKDVPRDCHACMKYVSIFDVINRICAWYYVTQDSLSLVNPLHPSGAFLVTLNPNIVLLGSKIYSRKVSATKLSSKKDSSFPAYITYMLAYMLAWKYWFTASPSRDTTTKSPGSSFSNCSNFTVTIATSCCHGNHVTWSRDNKSRDFLTSVSRPTPRHC